jgi:hypothetical protein
MEYVIVQQHYEVRWETAYGQYGTRWNTRTFTVEAEARAFHAKRCATAPHSAGQPTFRRITIEEMA